MGIGDYVLWNLSELWSERAREKGIPDLLLWYVEHAEKTGNVAYLTRIAEGTSELEDPHGRLANEARAALKRLSDVGSRDAAAKE